MNTSQHDILIRYYENQIAETNKKLAFIKKRRVGLSYTQWIVTFLTKDGVIDHLKVDASTEDEARDRARYFLDGISIGGHHPFRVTLNSVFSSNQLHLLKKKMHWLRLMLLKPRLTIRYVKK